MGLAALMLNALAARCVWHCGVLLRLLLAAPLLVLACGHALRSQTACCSWLPCCAGTNEGSGRLSHNEIRYCLPQTGLSSTMGDLITAPAAPVEARSQNARFFWVALFPSLPACPSKTGDSWWLIPCLREKKTPHGACPAHHNQVVWAFWARRGPKGLRSAQGYPASAPPSRRERDDTRARP